MPETVFEYEEELIPEEKRYVLYETEYQESTTDSHIDTENDEVYEDVEKLELGTTTREFVVEEVRVAEEGNSEKVDNDKLIIKLLQIVYEQHSNRRIYEDFDIIESQDPSQFAVYPTHEGVDYMVRFEQV